MSGILVTSRSLSQLEDLNTIRVRQVIVNDKDIQRFLKDRIPECDDDDEESICMVNLKYKYRHFVLLSCLLVKMASMFLYISATDSLSNVMNTPATWIIYLIGLFAQALFGFLVDIISLPLAFNLTVGMTAIGQAFLMYSVFFPSPLRQFIAVFIGQTTYSGFYVCGLSMIYESSFDLKAQFRNQCFFVLFGTYLPYLCIDILEYYTNNQSFLHSAFTMVTSSIVMLIIGTVLLVYMRIKIRGQAENTSQLSSDKYEFFMIRSALSIKEVLKYYSNADFMYLFIVAIMQLHTEYVTDFIISILGQQSKYFQYGSENDVTNLFSASCWVSALIYGYTVSWYLNRKEHFITRSYDLINIILKSLIIAYIMFVIVVSLSNEIPFGVLYVTLQIAVVYQPVVSFTLYFLSNQMFMCLQEDKIQLKGIGIGIIGILQDIMIIVFQSGFSNLTIFIILFTAVILVNVYNHYYRRNRNFDLLQNEHLKHFELSRIIQKPLISNQSIHKTDSSLEPATGKSD